MSKQDTSEFLAIGHRGCMALEPENTMRGFRRALELGCEMIETDLHLVDGELILLHDVRLERTTNGEGDLADISLEELRKLDAGKGEKVPLLTELMDLCAGKDVVLNLEIKGGGVVEPMLEMLERYPKQEVVVSSFDWAQLRDCHERKPELPLAVLVEDLDLVSDSLVVFKELGAVSWNPDLQLLNDASVKVIHDLGGKVYPFTVKTEVDLELVLAAGCDGAFVNDPIAVSEWLR